jgi:hypothetical protein
LVIKTLCSWVSTRVERLATGNIGSGNVSSKKWVFNTWYRQHFISEGKMDYLTTRAGTTDQPYGKCKVVSLPHSLHQDHSK